MSNGTMDKIKGSVKDAAGKVTGDRKLQAEGKADKARGHAKDAAEHVVKAVKEVRDSARKS